MTLHDSKVVMHFIKERLLRNMYIYIYIHQHNLSTRINLI